MSHPNEYEADLFPMIVLHRFYLKIRLSNRLYIRFFFSAVGILGDVVDLAGDNPKAAAVIGVLNVGIGIVGLIAGIEQEVGKGQSST